MSKHFPPYNSSIGNIKVELGLANYATKDDVKNITHVDSSSYASKTNLAALKTEVDKIDIDKLKTVPTDLAKLSNVKNDVVKKADYSAKVNNIENQIAGFTKNTVDKLADITKLKAVDTSNFVLKTKLASDVTTLETKIDTVDKKIPDISGLATKASLTSYLQTATFNSKVTEAENKIKATDIIAKSANTKANTIRSDLTGYAKIADVATDITAIKNDYVTNASLTSRLNDLKSQHIDIEVSNIDNKTKKNASDILALKSKSQQKEFTMSENERGNSFARGLFFYIDQRYFVYIHFQQNISNIPNNNNVINIYCVYQIEPISSSRDDTFTVQNTLFGAMQIIKNAATSKYDYKGYGICFDEGGQFGHTITDGGFAHTTNARNILIFGVDMSFSVHATNRANHIYVMGKEFVQGINDTTIYAEKSFYRNFTVPGKKTITMMNVNCSLTVERIKV